MLMQRKKKIYANEHEHIDFDGFSKEIFVDDEITHDLSYWKILTNYKINNK